MSDLSDFELCNCSWKRIVENHGNNPTAKDFNEYEQVIVMVWTLTGIIENGGFRYLFESELPGDIDFILSMKALGIIGCNEAEKILSEIIDRLQKVGDSRVSNSKKYEEISEDEQNRFDSRFWAEIDNINKQLAGFIRRNNHS